MALAPFAAGVGLAQTVVTSSRFDPRLRQVDIATQDVVAETVVGLEGKIVHGTAALAREPSTGTLFGVLAEARCPGDPTRPVLARGSCNEFTASAGTCAQAFAVNDGVPVSCVHNGSVCAPCVKANEGPLGCTNTCVGTPVCADPGRTFAGNGGCSLFSGDTAACVQKFAQSACGPAPCYVVPNGTQCNVCEPFAIAAGRCTPTCGALASRDPVHLVTIDTATGVATSRGELGDDVSGIAFTCEGELFGVTGDGRCRSHQTELVRIDPETAAITPGLAFPDDDGAALAFDAENGVLLRTGGVLEDASLLAIAPDTLAATVRPLSGPVLLDTVGGIAWEAATGDLLWSHAGVSGELFRVPADGVSVLLGEVGRRIDGIAFPDTGACTTCGDGAVEAPEQCDDGNVAGGDCCTAVCAADPAGTACTADDDPCTADVCDASAACTHALAGGLAGTDCVLGRLADPAVCAPDPLDARLARVLGKRAGKARALVGRAIANPARAEKRLRAARRHVRAAGRAVAKRRAKLTPPCASRLDAILAQLDPIL
jgi:cysteine-rich repeat protein